MKRATVTLLALMGVVAVIVQWKAASHGQVDAVSAPAKPSHVHTVLWLSGLYPHSMLAQLKKMQDYHVNGFLYDHLYQGLHDDVLNGGVRRLSSDSYAHLAALTRSITSAAAAKGISDIFLRLLYAVYVPTNPLGERYHWDIFDRTKINQFRQTFINQATFARVTGMKGIWLDMEPYNDMYQWREDQDPATAASHHSAAQVKAQYYYLGQIAERAMLAAYPRIRVMLSPSLGFDGTGVYLHYPDFFAGMVAVASRRPGAKGFILATEETYNTTAATTFPSFSLVYGYEMGVTPLYTNPVQYSPVRTVLQAYDTANGTSLWTWHLTHDTVSEATWPYNNNGTYRYSLHDFQQIVRTERTIDPQYTWVYDERGQWLQHSYHCLWQQRIITTTLACPGLVLRGMLPSLSAP